MGEHQTAPAYHSVKNKIYFANLLIDSALLLVLFYSGLSLSLKQWCMEFIGVSWILNAMYLVIFSIGMYMLHFPLSFFLGFYWEHKFDLSNQSFGAWFIDDLKKNAIGFAMFLLAMEVVFILLSRFPYVWWIGASSFWLLMTFILAKVTPNIIIPLFYKYTPIDNQQLKKKIFALFDACHVNLKDVYAINMSTKTKKANAFLCGLGSNRRVVLSDTLIDSFSDEEIEVVVAHELGHYKHQDILKLLAVNTVFIFVGFYLVNLFLNSLVKQSQVAALHDIVLLPMFLFAFVVFGIFITPFINAFSRNIERSADKFSLLQTKNKEGFISLMEKLGKMNLAEYEPSRLIEMFLYDHPPINKRIKFAQSLNI